MDETWVPVDGYEHSYEVSTHGRVRSLDRFVGHRGGLALKRGKLLKSYSDKNGYQQVSLLRQSERTKPKVHRLVAKHFLPNPQDLPEVNHLDLDKKNNHKDNLEWCSHKQNQMHAAKMGVFSAITNPKRAKKRLELT